MVRRLVLVIWMAVVLWPSSPGMAGPARQEAVEPPGGAPALPAAPSAETAAAAPLSVQEVPVVDDRAFRVPPTGAFDCASVWTGGIPRPGTGLTYCLEYWSGTIGGSEYRVLYPAEWSSEPGWGAGYLDLTVAALQQSVGVFGAFGTMAPITMVFSQLEYAGEADADEKMIVSEGGHEPCSIFISPRSMELTLDHYHQLMAHELFHCFQEFNFDFAAEDASSKWWVEGSAEYFSNVVYPNANLEWKLTSPFDATSPNTPLYQYSYAACFFFQYLGNTLGNPAVIAFLDAMPAGGGEGAQLAAMRAWEGMDTLFQEFAQQYLDVKLLDSSGAAIPFSPSFAPVRTVSASGTFEIPVMPFVIHREEIAFDPTSTFTFGLEPTSLPSMHAMRVDGGTWGPAPAVIDCDDSRAYKAAYTSIGDGSATPAVITATVNATEANCDEESDSCLVGDWQVADYATFLQAALDMAGATDSATPITFDGASGDLWFTFDASTITYAASGFALEGSASVQGIAVSVTIRIEGEATASYEVLEDGTISIIEYDTSGFSIQAESFVNGSSAGSMPIEPEQWIFFLSPTYGYVCTESTLELTIPPLTVPVVLNRT